MLPERWKKSVDSGGEYVEVWHVQVSVWQLRFSKNTIPGHIWTTLYYIPWNITLITIGFDSFQHTSFFQETRMQQYLFWQKRLSLLCTSNEHKTIISNCLI
jgi:predicted RNA-binding protein